MFRKFLTINSIMATSLLMATQGLMMMPPAVAKTIYRAHGRCKYTTDNNKVFDGHCVVKQKKESGETI